MTMENMMESYDVIVIGSGPGGYVCAIRAAQLGLKTACVEGRETLGGTCLNVGCIPSKALLHASHQYHELMNHMPKMGIAAKSVSTNWTQMLSYKNDAIASNTKGIEFLFKKNKIDWIKGWAKIKSSSQIIVEDTLYATKNIVVATGSTPSSLAGVEIDEKRIVSSTGALELRRLPKKMVIIGAGIIGLEIGSIYARLGCEVTVLEYLDHVTPGMDRELSQALQRTLTKQGITFELQSTVQSVEKLSSSVKVKFMDQKSGEHRSHSASVALVATGRRPYTEGLGLQELGVSIKEGGQIDVDENFSTNVSGIFAIGDTIRGPMLAHKAEDEGIVVAERIAGQSAEVNYGVIPSVVYTHPEVAAVGKTEEELKESGQPYRVGKFSLMGNARAKATFAAEGFVKLLSNAETDRILGCHMIGSSAGELIHEICVGMQFGAAAEDLALTCHAHPTLSEAVREAALACGDGAIHS